MTSRAQKIADTLPRQQAVPPTAGLTCMRTSTRRIRCHVPRGTNVNDCMLHNWVLTWVYHSWIVAGVVCEQRLVDEARTLIVEGSRTLALDVDAHLDPTRRLPPDDGRRVLEDRRGTEVLQPWL